MIRELKEKVSSQIQGKQNKKQKLYDDISKIDAELLELNEILVRLGDEDSFFRMSPNEAFDILERLGYKNDKEKLDIYFELISKKEQENNSYIHKIENIHEFEEQTEEQKRFSEKLIGIFDECFPSDDQYYYIANSKVNKFRLYYNMVNLFNGNFSAQEIMPMLATAFCYKSVKGREKDNVCKELDKINLKIKNVM